MRLISPFELDEVDIPLIEDPFFASSRLNELSDYDITALYSKLSGHSASNQNINSMRRAIKNSVDQGAMFLINRPGDPYKISRLVRWNGSKWVIPDNRRAPFVRAEVSRLNARGLNPHALESRRYRGSPVNSSGGSASSTYTPDTSKANAEKVITPVFARSRSVGIECTDVCTTSEPSSNSGSMAVLAGTASATGEISLGGLVNSTGKVLTQAAARLGSWTAKAARMTPGGFLIAGIFQPTQMGDGTIQGAQELNNKIGGTAETRVRFQIRRDNQGLLQVSGIHTSPGSGIEQVPVIQATQAGQKFEAEVGGITFTWTPNEGPVQPLSTEYPDVSPDMQSGITVFPISDNVGGNSTALPSHEVDSKDAIIVFPADSGVQPLYIVFNKPVQPLEVGTYSDMARRSKGDGLDIDHIPSRKAIESNALSNNSDLSEAELKAISNEAPSVAIPREVHQRASETYGGRNTRARQLSDAQDIHKTVDSNVNAISDALSDQGFSEEEIEAVRSQLHELHRSQGR